MINVNADFKLEGWPAVAAIACLCIAGVLICGGGSNSGSSHPALESSDSGLGLLDDDFCVIGDDLF